MSYIDAFLEDVPEFQAMRIRDLMSRPSLPPGVECFAVGLYVIGLGEDVDRFAPSDAYDLLQKGCASRQGKTVMRVEGPQPGDLVILSKTATPTHLGILLKNDILFSKFGKNDIDVCYLDEAIDAYGCGVAGYYRMQNP